MFGANKGTKVDRILSIFQKTVDKLEKEIDAIGNSITDNAASIKTLQEENEELGKERSRALVATTKLKEIIQ